MNTRIIRVCQRIGDALVTAVALAWFGLLGDRDIDGATRTEIDLADRAGSDVRF
jgi:hypothetical protein